MSVRVTQPLAQCAELTVLLVDQEPSFREGLAGALRDDGHIVLDFPTVENVPAIQSLDQVTLVILDSEMPGQSSLELADSFHASRPGVPIIIAAANSTGRLERQVATRPYIRLLNKDFTYDDLHLLIHDLVGQA